ncbi:hypothetical protein BSNK01_05840 [Bacillaceae bacterium]
MAEIIQIYGRVKYQITLDPGVWIFDDRKRPMDQIFDAVEAMESEGETYEKEISRQWERGMREGTIPTERSEKAFVEKKKIEGDYGIRLAPFLRNAEPYEDAREVVLHCEGDRQETIPLAEALQAVLCFAIDGKPIRDQGPVYFYFGDGRNRENPIKGLHAIEVR